MIARRLNLEQVPVISGKRMWTKTYVALILNDRAVLGEYQLHTGTSSRRQPIGDAIPTYYPAIVGAGDFARAQVALKSRQRKAGWLAKGMFNLFAHLLYGARSLSRMALHGSNLPNGGRV